MKTGMPQVDRMIAEVGAAAAARYGAAAVARIAASTLPSYESVTWGEDERQRPTWVHTPGLAASDREYDRTFGDVAALVSAVLRVGGEPELADRVRPSARRPGQTEELAEGDETKPPQAAHTERLTPASKVDAARRPPSGLTPHADARGWATIATATAADAASHRQAAFSSDANALGKPEAGLASDAIAIG